MTFPRRKSVESEDRVEDMAWRRLLEERVQADNATRIGLAHLALELGIAAPRPPSSTIRPRGIDYARSVGQCGYADQWCSLVSNPSRMASPMKFSPTTVRMIAIARVAFGTGTPRGATDVNAGWTR
jgi:hypothetical protein